MARRKRYLEEDINNRNQITEESHAEVETAGPETINGIIANAALVNVRKKPDPEAEVLETLRMGDKVTILGGDGSCYKVRTDSYYKVRTSVHREAYISVRFVKEE